MASVVHVIALVLEDARTAGSLGTQRAGAGVVIGADGLVLTIGYLIMEARELHIFDQQGKEYAAEFVAYDHATGFGLLRTIAPMNIKPARLGRSAEPDERGMAIAASALGARASSITTVISRRSFSGGWEYLLDRAIYTSPPIKGFGGAGLFGADGRLVGIGSLIIGDAAGRGDGIPGNMFVPIDLLKPILGDLLAYGRSTVPARPWLGFYPVETGDVLSVGRVAPESPAEAAGMRRGDIVLGVGEKPVRDMEAFYRAVWAMGEAGIEVPLKVLRGDKVSDLKLKSRDRMDWLKLRPSF